MYGIPFEAGELTKTAKCVPTLSIAWKPSLISPPSIRTVDTLKDHGIA